MSLAMAHPGAFLLTGDGDPLTGAYRLLEQRVLFLAGGSVLFIVTQESQDLAQAWREVYVQGLGAKRTGLVVLRKRAVAEDRALTEQVAAARLVWLASSHPEALLDFLVGSRLVEALASVVVRGGFVGAYGVASAIFGATAPIPVPEGLRYRYGLGLVPGVVVLPGFDQGGRFEALAEATAAHPDLVGIGLPRGSAVQIGAEGDAEVLAGRIVRLEAAASELFRKTIRNLQADLLAAGERFKVPVYHT